MHEGKMNIHYSIAGNGMGAKIVKRSNKDLSTGFLRF